MNIDINLIVRYLKFARHLYVQPGKFKMELWRIISIYIQYNKWKISRLLRLILYQQLFFFKEIITLLFIVSNFHIIKGTWVQRLILCFLGKCSRLKTLFIPSAIQIYTFDPIWGLILNGKLPSSAQVPSQLSWAELALISFPPAPGCLPGHPSGLVVK